MNPTLQLRITSILFTMLLFFLARPAAAAWPTDPHVNVPLCEASGGQYSPTMVSDGAGGAIVTWGDFRPGSYSDIYAQRISADGIALWTTNGVDVSTATGYQESPTIASDGAGGAIVTWQDARSGDYYVYAQRISADGIALWTANGVAVCGATPYRQRNPTIASDGTGGAIVSWQDSRNDLYHGVYDIYAQRISAAGTVQWPGNGVPLCTATGDQLSQKMVSDGEGGAIVTWRDFRRYLVGGYDIYTQRISANGTVQWTANGVGITNADDPAISPDGAGGAIVTWQELADNSRDVYAQRLSANGSFEWPVNGVALCTAAGAQSHPTITSDGAGGAIASWEDFRSGSSPDVYAQRISAGGTIQWRANGEAICTAAGYQLSPTIVSDDAGGAIVTWQDYRSGSYSDIYAQRISVDGVALWTTNGVDVSTATDNQLGQTMVSDGAGGAIVTWIDSRTGNDDIYAQQLNHAGRLGGGRVKTIATTAGPHGTITPSGTVAVTPSTSVAFAITADPCYSIADVLVDGFSLGAVSSYSFSNVTADHSIAASFLPAPSGVPSAPTALTVTNTGTSSALALAWTASPSSGVTGYTIYRSNSEPTSALATVSGLAYTDETVTRNMVYTYQVAAVSGCGEGAASVSVSRAPDYFPVLLVHGTCSSHTAFTDCSGAFPCQGVTAVKLGDALYQLGITRLHYVDYPWNLDATDAAKVVDDSLLAVIAEEHDPQVIIVAHSLGGLLSRYVIQNMHRAPLVSQLVMIGTPNHGTNLALDRRLADLGKLGMPWSQRKIVDATFCLGSTQLIYNQIPGSSFLTQLNYGPNRSLGDIPALCPTREPELLGPPTQYWLLHGTSGWCNVTRGVENALLMCVPNDGVVDTGLGTDGDLVSLDGAHKRQDVGLDTQVPPRLAMHTWVPSILTCNTEELKHPSFISAVYRIVTLQGLPGSRPAEIVGGHSTSQPARGAAATAVADTFFQDIAIVNGNLNPGVEQVDAVTVDAAGVVSFIQSAESGGLGFSVQAPGGRTYTLADSTTAGVAAVNNPDLALQSITISNPAAGQWISRTSGPAQGYSLEVMGVEGHTLHVQVYGAGVGGTPPAALRAWLSGLPVGSPTGTYSGFLVAPDSSVSTLSLFDDGQHADSLAGDGIYGALIGQTSQSGLYAARVNVSVGGSTPMQRTSIGTLLVEALADVAIAPSDLRVTLLSSGPPLGLQVQATLHNLGSVDAHHVLVDLQEGANAPFAKLSVDIAAGGQAVVSAPWQPVRTDTTSLRVYVDAGSGVLQSRYDNDSVSVVVRPATVSVLREVAASGMPQIIRAYPNPSAGDVTLEIMMPSRADATLRVYDLAGRRVATLASGRLDSGLHTVQWNRSDAHGGKVAPGVYYYEMRVGGQRLARRVVLLQ
jgi:FlgD Ig-like domain/PGAP1-like protein/Fibronectin type III domain